MSPPPSPPTNTALVIAPSSSKKRGLPGDDPTGGPLESWLRASRAIAGGAAFLLALAGAHVRVYVCMRIHGWMA